MTTESYSYSLDGETFYGSYATRKEAAWIGDGDAYAEYTSGDDFPSFFTARNVSVADEDGVFAVRDIEEHPFVA